MSAAFAEMGREAITSFNRRRHLYPKCGALSKSTGLPCGNLAGENGRCYLHGKRTPKGSDWHVRQPPVGKGKNAVRKMEAKILRDQKAAAARRLRLKRATAEEKANYERWLWTHPPGSAKRRAARRLDQRIAAQERILSESSLRVPDEETQALIDRIAELRARRALLEGFMSGVFG